MTNHLITETCLCRFVDIWTPAVWEFPLSVFFLQLSLIQSCTLKREEQCAHTLAQTFGFLCLLAALHQRKEVSEYTEE